MVEGPIATLLAAIASASGYMEPVLVFLAASLGNMTSDLFWYSLGYKGKIDWIYRYGRFFGVRLEDVGRMRALIHAHVLRILFIAKLTLGFIIPVLVATGLSRVPIRRWLWVLAVAETLWTGGLVVAGYYFGQYVGTFEKGLQIYAILCFVVVAIFAIRFVVNRRSHSSDHVT
jgi:membrane protein DedA with SNARE-associated domain